MHFVDDEYDTGPILAQRVVPVLPTDSPKRLAARVLKEVRLGLTHLPGTAGTRMLRGVRTISPNL